MKVKIGILVFLLAAAWAQAQTNGLTALLQQGLFEEQANRNLDAAIADYSALAAQFDKDRQLAATAVFRLGECYRAQGRTNEAAAQYQRILRDFSDQPMLATLSRQNLTGMGMAQPDIGKPAERLNAAPAAASSLAAQISGIEDLKSDLEEQARAVQAIFPDEELKTMLLQLPKLQKQETDMKANPRLIDTYFANGFNAFAAIGSKVIHYGDATNLLAEFQRQTLDQAAQIKERVNFILGNQKARLKVLQSAEGFSAPNAARNSAAPVVVGEEVQEIARIQTMIENSPDLINAPDGHGHTPLENAAINGWLKVAAFLLDHGADVNAGKVSALNQAANAGNRAMVEFLLSRGANINSKAWQGKTPLLTAVELGYPAVMEVLLANKADVNVQDDSGNTPLVPAVEKKQMKIVQALLAAGANPNLENKDGRTAFSFAAASGSPELVKMFLAAKADPNGGKLDAPLLVAIHAGDVASVELLLQAGANPNAKTKDDWQPNTFGAYGRPVGRGSETPIKLAVSSRQLPIVQLLLKFKADPNDSQTDGQSVLFHANYANSDTNLLAALLEAGGKADARRWDGLTLLDGAVINTNLTAVQLLLKFKADPNEANYEGRSVLFRALADTNILKALLDAGAKVDPVTPDETEWTPLAAAANQKNAAAVELLLKHGANPNYHNRNGVTPLHWAAYGHADSDVFKLLLDAKADPNVRTSNGRTPLDEIKGNQTPSSGGGIPIARFPRPGMIPAPGAPLSYQWSAGNPDTSSPDASGTNIVALLHQYGALDNLPNWDRIAVSRPAANFSTEIFHKSTNDWNHFTLLDLIYNTCASYNGQIPFPDFSRVTVDRPGTNGAASKRIDVNLLTATNSLDFAKDLPLEFGDVVEIPERGHTLAEHDDWLTDQYQKLIGYFRDHARSVRLVVTGGKTVQVPLNDFMPTSTYLGQVLKSAAAQNALISGSDLSRVKVTRRNLTTNQATDWLLNCSRLNEPSNSSSTFRNCPDLLLRDGDEIEVPLKP